MRALPVTPPAFEVNDNRNFKRKKSPYWPGLYLQPLLMTWPLVKEVLGLLDYRTTKFENEVFFAIMKNTYIFKFTVKNYILTLSKVKVITFKGPDLDDTEDKY